MRTRAALFGGGIALFAFAIGQKAPAPPPEEAHSLLPKVKVGDRFHYAFRNTIRVGETTMVLTMKIAMTIAKRDEKGHIAFRNEQSEGRFLRGGQESKLPDSVNTTTFRLDGELIDSEPAPPTPEQKRMSRIMQMRVPKEPAKAGTKWTWREEPAESGGGVGREGSGELVAFEDRLGMRCAKIRYGLKETSGEKPCRGTMEVWFSLADGLPVEVSMHLENVPIAPGTQGTIDASNLRTKP